MAFARYMECFGINFSDHIPQVQFAVRNVLDLFTADSAQVAVIATSHNYKPKTSNIEYCLAGLPIKYFAAAIAPLA